MPGRLDSLGAVAKRLVDDFGKTATLTRFTRVNDRATGKTTATASAPETVIVTPPTPFATGNQGQTQGQRRIPGAVIQEGDLIAEFGALSQAKPSIGDRLTLDGEDFQIVAIGTTYSGENAALYPVQLRV